MSRILTNPDLLFSHRGHQALAEAIAAGFAWPLGGNPFDLLESLVDAGPLQVAMGQPGARIVSYGEFTRARWRKDRATITAGALDLRLRTKGWRSLWAFKEPRPTLVVSDAHGMPALLLGPERLNDFEFWRAHLASFIGSGYTGPSDRFEDVSRQTPDRAALLDSWSRMKDTHQFGPMLRRFGTDRLQAIQAVEGVFSHRLDITSTLHAPEAMLEYQRPIMGFIENNCGIQIQCGTPSAVSDQSGKIISIANGSAVIIDWEAIQQAWLVCRPTSQGPVHSIEAYDMHGEPLVKWCGHRPWGEAEDEVWTNWVGSLLAPSLG